MTLEIANGELPSELYQIIYSGRCVAFIGCGLSMKGYGNWPDLINKLCEACCCDRRVDDNSPRKEYLDAAQEAKDTDASAYFGFLGTHFGRPIDGADFVYDALLALPFACYLTVNLDPGLAMKAARVARRAGELPIYAYPSLDRKHMSRRTVNYIHGYVGEGKTPIEGTIVLAKDEFDEAYGPDGKVRRLLTDMLENDPVMFIGCGLQEPPMQEVFNVSKKCQRNRQRIADELGQARGELPPRFIIKPRPAVTKDRRLEDVVHMKDDPDKQEAYYRGMGIEIVWYTAHGGDHSALRKAFDRPAGFRAVTPVHGWRETTDVL